MDELSRLANKLEKMDAWFAKQDDLDIEDRDPRYAEREDAWMSTESRYRKVYDRARVGPSPRSIYEIQQAEMRLQSEN